jgi:RNA polymerase sigma-70 factor (ECF subfamily)
VATNACLDELRRRRRRPTVALDQERWDDQAGAATTTAGIEVLPDRLAIDAALARLPEEFRVAVVLRDLCDLDYAEIADALQIPPGTVRSRIARGRTLLARHLGAGNPTAAPGRPTEDPGDR